VFVQNDRQRHRSTEGLYGVPVGMELTCVPVPAGGPATEGGVMNQTHKTIIMLVHFFGLIAMIAGIIGTARKWFREGIDLEFLIWATFLYCICEVFSIFRGESK